MSKTKKKLALLVSLVLSANTTAFAVAEGGEQLPESTGEQTVNEILPPEDAGRPLESEEALPENSVPAETETQQPEWSEEASMTAAPEELETQAPVATEAPTPEKTEIPPFTARVRIELKEKVTLYYGDRVTLQAKIDDANAAYTVCWEYYDEEASAEQEKDVWALCAKGEEYAFTLNAVSAARKYRVVLNDAVISDVYKLPEVTERPAEDAAFPEEDAEAEPEETTAPELPELPEEPTDPEASEELEKSEPEASEEPAGSEETEGPQESEEPEGPQEPEEPEDPQESEEPSSSEAPAETEAPETDDPEEREPDEEADLVPGEEPDDKEDGAWLEPSRSVSIHVEWEGDVLRFGDESTLVAELTGYDNVAYTLQWQTSKDNTLWSDVEGATAPRFTMTVTEENHLDYWRVVVTVMGETAE